MHRRLLLLLILAIALPIWVLLSFEEPAPEVSAKVRGPERLPDAPPTSVELHFAASEALPDYREALGSEEADAEADGGLGVALTGSPEGVVGLDREPAGAASKASGGAHVDQGTRTTVLGQPCTVRWIGGTRITTFDAGGTCSEVEFAGRKRHGYEIAWYPNGQLRWRGRWQDNKRVGYWEYFNESGTMAQAGGYTATKRSGEWRFYWPDGSLESLGPFTDGRREGDWVFYDRLGLVDDAKSGTFLNGEKAEAESD